MQEEWLHSKAEFAIERLAWAQYKNGMYVDAHRSLLKLAGWRQDPGIWNNIALTLWKSGAIEDAVKFFNQAISEGGKADDNLLVRIYNNYIRMLYVRHRYTDVVAVATRFLSDHGLDASVQRRDFGPSLTRYILSLGELGATGQAQSIARRALSTEGLEPSLRESLLVFLTSSFALDSEKSQDAFEFAKRSLELFFEQKHPRSTASDLVLVNNAVFAFLENGSIEEASKVIKLLDPNVYKSPHQTATMGLYYFRIGQLERGRSLYRSAIGLSRDDDLKEKIRQKLNFEMARYFHLHGRPADAAYYAKKVTFSPIKKFGLQAQEILAELKSGDK